MLRIEHRQQLGLGGKSVPKGFFPETFTNKADAVAYIKEYLKRFDISDYNGEQDYWWGRNEGDNRNAVLIIEESPPQMLDRTPRL